MLKSGFLLTSNKQTKRVNVIELYGEGMGITNPKRFYGGNYEV